MRFVVENALSPSVAEGLRKAGHDAVHVRDYGMQGADDEEIFARAAAEDRILISADTDFGTLLALGRESKPSVTCFGGVRSGVRNGKWHFCLRTCLAFKGLEEGSVVVLEQTRLRIRSLPIGGEKEG